LKPNEIFHNIKSYTAGLCALLILGFVLTAIGCFKKPAQQEYITIGALFPLSGNFSSDSISKANGLQIAKDEINESGGILGKKLDVIILNDRDDPDFAIQQYKTLKEKVVVAIIGSIHSEVRDAIMDAAENDGMPVVVPLFPMFTPNSDETRERAYVYYLPYVSLDTQSELLTKFTREYYSRFSKEPPPTAIATYLSVIILSEAITNAGSTNNDDVIAAIRASNTFGTDNRDL